MTHYLSRNNTRCIYTAYYPPSVPLTDAQYHELLALANVFYEVRNGILINEKGGRKFEEKLNSVSCIKFGDMRL